MFAAVISPRRATLLTLRSFFEDAALQRRALDSLFTAWGGPWNVTGSLDLYEASRRAFDPASSPDEAFRNFERIYDMLKSNEWQVFRPHSPSVCWPPEQIFETIKREFVDFAWGGPVNLPNFPSSGLGVRLESRLAKMQGVKPKKQYPLMTVSKFLHFYNPSLFPIYDNAVIWEKVLNGRFKGDYRVFVQRERIPQLVAMEEDTAVFLRHYMVLASSLLAVAHAGFMKVFADWFAEQPGANLTKRSFDPMCLYASAFEFTAIGASAV
jgi:hypothetical protein